MYNKWRTYFYAQWIIITIVFWINIRTCNEKKNNEQDIDTLLKIHYRDSSELVKKTNRLGQVTMTAEAFELNQKNLDKYISDNSDLKNKLTNLYKHVNSVNTTTTNTHIDTIKVKVPVHDTIPCGDIDKSYPVLDRFYSFDFKFKNKKGHEPEYSFVNINIPDTITEVIGIKKSGFLNMKHALVSEQTHTNKYIQIKGIQTIVKSEAKPKTLNKIILGFGLGMIATIVTENKFKK